MGFAYRRNVALSSPTRCQTPCSSPLVFCDDSLLHGLNSELPQPKVRVSLQLYLWPLHLSVVSPGLCALNLLHSWLEALLALSWDFFLWSQSSTGSHTRATRTRKTRPIRRRFWALWSQRTGSGVRRTRVIAHRNLPRPLHPICLPLSFPDLMSFSAYSPRCWLTFLESGLCG